MANIVFDKDFGRYTSSFVDTHILGAEWIAQCSGLTVKELHQKINEHKDLKELDNILMHASATIEKTEGSVCEAYATSCYKFCPGSYRKITAGMDEDIIIRLTDDFIAQTYSQIYDDVYRLTSVSGELYILTHTTEDTHVIHISSDWEYFSSTKDILLEKSIPVINFSDLTLDQHSGLAPILDSLNSVSDAKAYYVLIKELHEFCEIFKGNFD